MPDVNSAGEDDGLLVSAPSRRPREPLLDQGEIDRVMGFEPAQAESPAGGAQAMLGAGAAPREPMPMLAVVFEDAARRLSLSLRSLFGTDADVTLSTLAPRRYAGVIEEIVLPCQTVSFRAEGWDGAGLLALGPDFATLALDQLLGGGGAAGRAVARPFSAIETAILSRIADAVLLELCEAFRIVTPVTFRRDRIEADPRLGPIAGPGDMTLAATLSLSLAGRSASLLVVLPLATLESARAALQGDITGAKWGRDGYWASHLATEIWQSTIEVEAVLHETRLPLRQILGLSIGDTLMFECKPTDPIELRCGGLPVTRGQIGRVDGRIAVQVSEQVSRPRAAGRAAGRKGMMP